MKIRALQFCPVLGSIRGNLDFHLSALQKAASAGIDLVVFPELSLSGYQLKDLIRECALRPDSPEIKELSDMSRTVSFILGAPYEDPPGIFYNCALFFSGGRLRHLHRKVQLPNFGIFEEKMIFRAGSTFLPFKAGELQAGILICREILFPTYAYLYFLQGVELLIGISNSPQRGIGGQSGFSSFALWETMGELFSRFFHFNYLFVNRTGFEEGIGFGGGSFFAAPGSGITSRAAYVEDSVLDISLDPLAVRRARIAGNYLRDEDPGIVLRELQRITGDKNGLPAG